MTCILLDKRYKFAVIITKKKKNMKNLKLLSVVFFTLVIFLASCAVKADKGKEILDKAAQNTIDQIDALSNSDFTDGIKSFFFVDDPFDQPTKKLEVSDINKIKNIGTALKNSIIKKFPGVFNKKFGDTTFSLASYAGTYTWNDTAWTFSSTPADKIILIFPSPTSITNDLRLEWSTYAEVKANDDYYYPTEIYAELFKDNKKIGVVDYKATWNLDFQYPLTVDAKLQLDPMKFDINYTFESSISTLDAHVSKGMRTLDDIHAEVTFKNDSMYDVTYAKGQFKTYDLTSSVNTGVLMKVIFDANIEALPDSPTAADLNDNVSIEFYSSSNRLFANIEFNDSDECPMNFVFTEDGSKESVCDYIDRIGNAMENMLFTSGLFYFGK